MGESAQMSVAGSFLAIVLIVSAILDLITAFSIPQNQQLASLTALFLVAFSFQLLALASLLYFYLFFTKQTVSPTNQQSRWPQYWAGNFLNTTAVTLTFSALIWLATRQSEMKQKQHGLVVAGFTISVLCIFSHIVVFIILFSHGKKSSGSHSIPRVTITHSSTTEAPMKENKFIARSSYCSRDPTLASRACTPTSSRTYSLHSATTRVGTSIRSKIGKGRGSARSSLELPALPGSEVRSTSPNAFDRYDTSNIDPETRNTILSSSPILNRSGLDPIPGSRTVTPNRSLEEVPAIPAPPNHPQTPSSPKSSKPNPFETPCSPPASPPNFSRPTSRSQPKASMSGMPDQPPPRMSTSMTDLIHPLFRPNSPSPPQILTAGTMVTASPLANQPITPKTLSRLRSDSQIGHKTSYSTTAVVSPTHSSKRESIGQWRTMPNVEANYAAVMARPRPRSKSHSSTTTTTTTKRPTTAGSISDMTDAGRPSTRGGAGGDATETIVGSPGPSIADEEDLPPIGLPGFVLSAGSRSSLVGYGKRKSVKRGSGQLSISRL